MARTRVAAMRIRRLAVVAATTAVVLAGVSCGVSSEQGATPGNDLDGWVADTLPPPAEGGFSVAGRTSPDGGRSTGTASEVEPGWYALTVSCAPTGVGADSNARSMRVTLSGDHGTYGGGDCSSSPVTTTTYLGDSAEAGPDTITVSGEADAGEFFWGASASPAIAPK
jgi:hypothetical protein